MPFTEEEKNVIKRGKEQGKDVDDIEIDIGNYRQSLLKPAEGLSEPIIDLIETLKGYEGVLRGTGEKIVDTVTSDIPVLEKILGVGAETFRGIGRSVGELAIGAGKVALPERAERAVERGVEKVAGRIGETKFVQGLVKKYETLPPDTKRLIDNALGFSEGLLAITTGKEAGAAGLKALRGVTGKAAELTGELVPKGLSLAERVTPDTFKMAYQRLDPITRTAAIQAQKDAFQKSFLHDKPSVETKFRKIYEGARAKDKKLTEDKLLENFIDAGFVPKVEGKLAKFDDIIDDIAKRQIRLAESIDPLLSYVPNITKLDALKEEAKIILKESRQIGPEFQKSLGELDRWIESLRTKYGGELTAIQVNEVRKQMNRYTSAFEGEFFLQDTADALADAARKKLDEFIPTGTAREINREWGRFEDYKKIARLLNNKQIDVGVFGNQSGRLAGTIAASGLGLSVGGPGGLVIAGIAAHYGGSVVAQMLRKMRFTDTARKKIIEYLKTDDRLILKLIKEADGEDKAYLERLFLPSPGETAIPLGGKGPEARIFSQEEAVERLKELGVLPKDLKIENLPKPKEETDFSFINDLLSGEKTGFELKTPKISSKNKTVLEIFNNLSPEEQNKIFPTLPKEVQNLIYGLDKSIPLKTKVIKDIQSLGGIKAYPDGFLKEEMRVLPPSVYSKNPSAQVLDAMLQDLKGLDPHTYGNWDTDDLLEAFIPKNK